MNTGYTRLGLTKEQYTQVYSEQKIDGIYMKENEYLVAVDENDEVVDIFCYQDGKFRPAKIKYIKNDYIGTIKPRNTEQHMALDLLQDSRTRIKLIRGVQGSGKDYLMLSQALSLVEKGKFEKIVFLRPNLTVRDLPDIGALPGTAEEKLSWTLGPLYDKVGGEYGVDQLVRENKLEAIPFVYIRGRSFENAIVYVTEGQNMTTAIAKLLISRVGEGSELWINADTNQTDKKVFDKDSGVTKMVEKFAGNELFGHIYLPTTERSAVARMANLLDE